MAAPTPTPTLAPAPTSTSTPTPTLAKSLNLTDISSKVSITAVFESELHLDWRPGRGWLLTVTEPASIAATPWTFWIPYQSITSAGTPPVNVTLIRSSQTWATLAWRPLNNITATPLTTTSSTTSPTSSLPLSSSTGTTSPPTPTTSSSSRSSEPQKNGIFLTHGEAAGLGVGSAIAGGLLAFILGLVCLGWKNIGAKGRKNTRLKNSLPVRPEPSRPPDPQLISHVKLREEAILLREAIRRYAENYLSPATTTQPRIGDLYDAQLSQLAAYNESWRHLFLVDEKRYNAWRMFIARVLAARMDRKGAPEVTLLPAQPLRHYQSILNGEKSSTHYDAWRESLAGINLDNLPQGSSFRGPDDARNVAVDETVHDIQEALGPFRHRKRDGAHTEHEPLKHEHEALQNLVLDAALFGWRLFDQSQITELFWSDSLSDKEVFPGVRRIHPQAGGQASVILEPSGG